MCVYVCVCIYTNTYMQASKTSGKSMCMYTDVCTCMYTRVCSVHKDLCVCTEVYMYIYIYAHHLVSRNELELALAA